MTAEILQRSRDGVAMMAVLRELPEGFAHSYPDLAPLLSLATGSALRLLRDERAALVHLRVAFRSVREDLKAGVALSIAECFADLDEPVPAWAAAREAEALEKDEDALRRIRARRAELEESMGALGRSIETSVSILKAAAGPFEGADRVLATLARCLIATDKTDDARTALEALVDHGAYRGWALFQLASLDRRAREPEKALRALARLMPGGPVRPGPFGRPRPDSQRRAPARARRSAPGRRGLPWKEGGPVPMIASALQSPPSAPRSSRPRSRPRNRSCSRTSITSSDAATAPRRSTRSSATPSAGCAESTPSARRRRPPGLRRPSASSRSTRRC